MNQVEYNTLLLAILRISVFMHADPFGGGQLRFHAIIGKGYGIIAGTGNLRIVRIARTIPAIRVGGGSRIQFQLSGSRNNQDIP